jgi:hypothetical protein
MFMSKISTTAESRAHRNKRMVSEMSNARTLWWVGVALVIHAVIILGTSKEYIRVHWFGGTPAPEVASGDEAPATPAIASQSPATPATPANAAAPAAKSATPQATAGLSDDDKKLAERSNSPMVKSITDTAKPSELPKVNPLELNEKP